jgi:hypothetical protein
MRPRWTAAVVTLAVAVAGSAFAAAPEVATVAQVAQRVDPPDRAVLISDSAWLGIHFYGTVDVVQGFPHTLALASCRRRVVGSCTNYDGFVPVTLLDVVEAEGDRYSTLIVATGYNDGDRAFAEEFETIVSTARSLGYRRIVWVTLRSNGVTYESPDDFGFAAVFDRNNTTLAQLVASGEYPDVVIADWATYARQRTEWFADDGIHLRPRGTYAASDYISRKLAYLDGRACPQPVRAGDAPHDPCPDPDVTGAVVDLASVYPVDRSAPRPAFRMEFVGHGSWPDPPWWER